MLAAKLIDFTLYNKLIEEGKALRTVTRHSGAVYEYLDNNTLVIISKTSLPQHLGKDNIYIGEFINPQTGKIEKVYLSWQPYFLQCKDKNKNEFFKLYRTVDECPHADKLYGNLKLKMDFANKVHELIESNQIDFNNSVDVTQYIYIVDWLYAEIYLHLFVEYYGHKMLDPNFEKKIVEDLDLFFKNPNRYATNNDLIFNNKIKNEIINANSDKTSLKNLPETKLPEE